MTLMRLHTLPFSNLAVFPLPLKMTSTDWSSSLNNVLALMTEKYVVYTRYSYPTNFRDVWSTIGSRRATNHLTYPYQHCMETALMPMSQLRISSGILMRTKIEREVTSGLLWGPNLCMDYV